LSLTHLDRRTHTRAYTHYNNAYTHTLPYAHTQDYILLLNDSGLIRHRFEL